MVVSEIEKVVFGIFGNNRDDMFFVLTLIFILVDIKMKFSIRIFYIVFLLLQLIMSIFLVIATG